MILPTATQVPTTQATTPWAKLPVYAGSAAGALAAHLPTGGPFQPSPAAGGGGGEGSTQEQAASIVTNALRCFAALATTDAAREQLAERRDLVCVGGGAG